jgi:hypothetical protein
MIAGGELPPPNCLKIDVEGAEMLVLSGARSLLATARPIVFLATHGPDLHQQCCGLLQSLGYHLEAIGGSKREQLDEMLALPAA